MESLVMSGLGTALVGLFGLIVWRWKREIEGPVLTLGSLAVGALMVLSVDFSRDSGVKWAPHFNVLCIAALFAFFTRGINLWGKGRPSGDKMKPKAFVLRQAAFLISIVGPPLGSYCFAEIAKSMPAIGVMCGMTVMLVLFFALIFRAADTTEVQVDLC